jgi:nucleoside phosphorylase
LKLLIAAAWEPELSHLREGRGTSGLGLEGVTITLAPIGVGLVEAAIGMTRCIERHRPSLALFVGTAGSFADALFETVVGAKVHLVESSLVAAHAALPEPMPDEAVLDAELHAALVAAGGRSVQFASTVGVTVDDALAARLQASRGDDVEHLEAFAFARACAVAGVRCGILLGVANVVGSRGRAEWLANHVRVSTSVAEVALRALPSLVTLLRTTTTGPSPERA